MARNGKRTLTRTLTGPRRQVEPELKEPGRELRTLKRRTLLYQSVQQELKSYIIANGLKAGDPLPPETELSLKLGVSRTSVREAVKSLESLGILEARTGAGLYVRAFSFDPLLDNLAYGLMFDVKQLAEIMEIRLHIEHGMAERAVAAATPVQLERLEVILDRMRTDAQRGHYSPDDDRAFHQTLWENVGNRLLEKILDVFWSVFSEARKRAALPEPLDATDTYKRHKSIVEALVRRDADALKKSMIRHYEGIQRRLQRLVNPDQQ